MTARRSRGFAALWASTGASSVGDGAFDAAVPLLAAWMTDDPVAVSIVSAATALPWLTVGLFAGAWADRLPRRLVLAGVDLARAVALVLLAVLIVTGTASVWALAIAAFLVTAGRTLFDAAAQAVVPEVIAAEGGSLEKANARIYTTETLGGQLAGPPLGSALFAVAPWLPFLLDAASFGASSAVLSRLPVGRSGRVVEAGQSILVDIREGLAFLGRNAELLALAGAMAVFNVSYRLASSTLVLYASHHLHMAQVAFGPLLAASSVGGLAAGMVSARVLRAVGAARTVVGALTLQAVAWAVVLTAPSGWVAGGGMALAGASATLVTVAAVTRRQQVVPAELLGRTVAAFRLIGNGISPVGAVVGGVAAAWGGLTAPLWLALALLVVGGLAASLRFIVLARRSSVQVNA